MNYRIATAKKEESPLPPRHGEAGGNATCEFDLKRYGKVYYSAQLEKWVCIDCLTRPTASDCDIIL